MTTRSYKGLTGHWSKYGGRRDDAIPSQKFKSEVYGGYCQVCGKEQPPPLSMYKVKRFTGDYLRICALCYVDDWEKKLRDKIDYPGEFS